MKTLLRVSPPSNRDHGAGIDPAAARPLFHAHPWLCAGVGRKNPKFFSSRAGGQHHAIGKAEFHFARCEICDHHCESAFERFRIVSQANAGEDIARLAVAEIDRELQELVGALDIIRFHNARDAQINLGKAINRDQPTSRSRISDPTPPLPPGEGWGLNDMLTIQ